MAEFFLCVQSSATHWAVNQALSGANNQCLNEVVSSANEF